MFDRQATRRAFNLDPLEGSKLKRYAVALLVMTAALALRSVFQPLLGASGHFISISAATVFAAWYCGIGPAALSTILGMLAANVLFVAPYRLLGPLTEQDVAAELLFLLICAAIIAVGEGGRRALLRLGHAHETLLRSRTHLKFRVRQKTAQLQQGNKDLRDLSVRLMRVQDDERRRIARDLHDSTGQALTALKLELASIERELEGGNPEIAVRLAACIGDARMISDELRAISYLLHPPLLDELGLGSALRWYVDGFEKRCGIAVNLELNITERHTPEMETMLFRVVQECLINIHRHAGSAIASIRLSHTERKIIMEVEDEGRGLTVDELSAIASGESVGVGLRGMRERVSDFGGELEVLSTGQGTKVRAVIPIDVRSRGIPVPAVDIRITSKIVKRATAN